MGLGCFSELSKSEFSFLRTVSVEWFHYLSSCRKKGKVNWKNINKICGNLDPGEIVSRAAQFT